MHGGVYTLAVAATFGGGSVTLEVLGADGSTYIPCGAPITAAGSATYSLFSGTYQLLVTTATAVVATLGSLP